MFTRLRSFLPDLPSLFAALAAAGLAIASFPPFSLWFLAWIALAPLVWGIARTTTLAHAFLVGWFSGTVFFYGTCWWLTHSMIEYGGMNFLFAHGLVLVICLVTATLTGAFAVFFQAIYKHNELLGVCSVPFVWTATEWLRLWLLGIGWNFLGYSQAEHPVLIQSARFAGVYGVSFALAATAALLVWAVRRRTVWALAGAVVVVGGVFLDGTLARRRAPAPPATVTDVVAVQPMVPILLENEGQYGIAIARNVGLSEQGLAQSSRSPKLVVWPESQLGVNLDIPDDPAASAVRRLARDRGCFVLFNGVRESGDKFFNLAGLVGPDGMVRGEYRKVHLLPFGEYIPLRSLFSTIGFTPIAIDAVPADVPEPLPFDGNKLGASVCFEAAFPAHAVELRRRGAGALVNIANDGWFGNTPGTRQHLNHLIFRAVETGCDTVRVTNTGIGARITSFGDVLDRTPQMKEAVRVWPTPILRPDAPMTAYARFGDVFALTCVALTTLGVGWAATLRLRRFIEDLLGLVEGD